MTHEEKRIYLIRHLLAESPRFAGLEIPNEIRSRSICINGDIGEVICENIEN